MLTAAQREALKARAHKLEPVVRAAGLERDVRDETLSAICEKTGAQAVQQVGKVFVLFRKNDE
jgi:RNA-binding protein YhbY